MATARCTKARLLLGFGALRWRSFEDARCLVCSQGKVFAPGRRNSVCFIFPWLIRHKVTARIVRILCIIRILCSEEWRDALGQNAYPKPLGYVFWYVYIYIYIYIQVCIYIYICFMYIRISPPPELALWKLIFPKGILLWSVFTDTSTVNTQTNNCY